MYHRAVIITEGAARDIIEIDQWLSANDSTKRSTAILGRILSRIQKLSEFPLAGPLINELRQIGHGTYRHVFVAGYRIVYRSNEDNVFILAVLHQRRSLTRSLR